MIDRTFLTTMTHEYKEELSESCEDFLVHRHIPLHSHSYDNIIMQAIKEGYQLNRFQSRYIESVIGGDNTLCKRESPLSE